MRPRSLLITLDAFDTLFHPRLPVPQQYAQTAHAFGLSPSLVTSESLQPAFKAAFKAHAKQHPNYGRDLAVRGQYGGPRQWWAEVIEGSFARVLGLAQDRNVSNQLPQGLVQRLLDRFASSEGYALYPDVPEFMARMRDVKTQLTQRQAPKNNYAFGSFERVVVGVVSNSDDRISTVLESLGLSVGDMRADQDVSSMRLPGFEERAPTEDSGCGKQLNDLDLVITSYDAGAEKPSRVIFDVAKRQAMRLAGSEDESDWVCVHAGDDYDKDFQAAMDAGWEGFYIPREGTEKATVRSLTELYDVLQAREVQP